MSTASALPTAIPAMPPLDKPPDPPPDDEASDVDVDVRNGAALVGSSSTRAARRSSTGHPSLLHGLDAQHPIKGGIAPEQVYQLLSLWGATQF